MYKWIQCSTSLTLKRSGNLYSEALGETSTLRRLLVVLTYTPGVRNSCLNIGVATRMYFPIQGQPGELSCITMDFFCFGILYLK